MEIYHIVNRGVDKRSIVQDEEDRVRFIHDLYVLNDRQQALRFDAPTRKGESRKRRVLVRIHAFCLMPNHYHLLLSPTIKNGVPEFMKKLNMGYTKYFNEKYNRSGALWQGKYRKKLIERDAHFLYVPYYVHLNALDLTMPEWREGKVKDTTKALQALRSYRWSSHKDYLGEYNFPSITEREFLAAIIGTKSKYEREIKNIICNPEHSGASLNLE